MAEPAKPFACSIPDCGMTFTNEDHLHVHTKKHDMVLQLGLEQKAAFVADQTPTPTRFIRNCEEVGLFQDLQNVQANPFDEGFKRAMETKAGILSLEATITQTSDDVLHTPQMVFPLLDGGEPPLFNTQRNITISRSSSDESGAIKEFETRTISKLTNAVTTISRIVNSDDVTIKQTDIQKDVETVSYKNNVIRIESNIIRKDVDSSKVPVLIYTDSVIKETTKDNIMDTSKLMPEKLPIMSQKSLDYVVDSLTAEQGTNTNPNSAEENFVRAKNNSIIFNTNKPEDHMAKLTKILRTQPVTTNDNNEKIFFYPAKDTKKKAPPRILPKKVNIVEEKANNDVITGYEVVIKLPDGKQVRMKPVDDPDPKEVIRNKITKKIATAPNVLQKAVKSNVRNIVQLPTGTLIPVTLVNKTGTPLTNNALNNVPMTIINKVPEVANITLPMSFNPVGTKTVNLQKTPPPLTPVRPKKIQDRVRRYRVVRKVPIKPSISSPELHLKVSEPYQMNDKSKEKSIPKAQDNVCITEEIIKRKIEENNRLETNKNTKHLEDDDDDCVVVEDGPQDAKTIKTLGTESERKCAASKRYRERLKSTMRKHSQENRLLREANQRLVAEKAVLKLIITEHMKGCPNASDIAHRLNVLTTGGGLQEANKLVIHNTHVS